VTFLSHQALVLGQAPHTCGREGVCFTLVDTVRMVGVLRTLQRLTLQTVRTHTVVVLCREETTLVTPGALLDTTLQAPVPELAKWAKAFGGVVGRNVSPVEDFEGLIVAMDSNFHLLLGHHSDPCGIMAKTDSIALCYLPQQQEACEQPGPSHLSIASAHLWLGHSLR